VAFLALKPAPQSQNDQAAADSASADDIGFKAEGTDEELELEDGEEPLGAIYPLDTVLVNLSGGKFIRCQVQLEFSGRDVPKKFFSHVVPIRDEMIRLFTSRSEADVTSSKGKAQLKADIKAIVAAITKKDLVKNVYFTQFIVQ
jgi:flagellar FliL protein